MSCWQIRRREWKDIPGRNSELVDVEKSLFAGFLSGHPRLQFSVLDHGENIEWKVDFAKGECKKNNHTWRIRAPTGWVPPGKPLVAAGPVVAVEVLPNHAGKILRIPEPQHQGVPAYILVKIPPFVSCGPCTPFESSALVILPMPIATDDAGTRVPPSCKVEYRVVKDMFTSFDSNGDGLISAKELAQIMMELDPHMWDADKAQSLLSCIDTAEDGFIQYDEFVSWVFSLPSHHIDAVYSALQSGGTAPHVNIVNPAGILQARFKFDPSEKVSALKEHLDKQVSSFQRTLVFNDRVLDDAESLEECGLVHDSTVTVVTNYAEGTIRVLGYVNAAEDCASVDVVEDAPGAIEAVLVTAESA